MKLTKQNWQLVVVAFLIGIVAGSIVSFYVIDNIKEKAFRIYLDQILSWEENEAMAKFKAESSYVAIYAQERLISYANRLKEVGVINENNYLKVVGFAEARNGFLYESIGDISKSEEYFNRAIATLKKANLATDIKELKALLISSKGVKE